jgi:hypothetical protein
MTATSATRADLTWTRGLDHEEIRSQTSSAGIAKVTTDRREVRSAAVMGSTGGEVREGEETSLESRKPLPVTVAPRPGGRREHHRRARRPGQRRRVVAAQRAGRPRRRGRASRARGLP